MMRNIWERKCSKGEREKKRQMAVFGALAVMAGAFFKQLCGFLSPIKISMWLFSALVLQLRYWQVPESLK